MPEGREGTAAALRGGSDPKAWLARHADVALAAAVVAIVAMMIVPLPTFLLDLLVSINIAAAVVLLLISLYVSEALKIATLPTLLLLTTLFRLAIEVSATRLILLRADAGHVIKAFGNFVVAGNVVVGAVIFLILTLIQFLVVAKGSERVAEVGARFTLDAMPGKQMSIDAELRAGHIDHAEARRRRAALARESQFFGAMDGAMKFVKGDAIAGIVVLGINIVGGLVIGVFQRGMDAGAAARTYTILTIGEGLVAQIPALVISTAAGVIVTRVSSEEEGGHLGRDIGGQLLAQPKALAIAAALLGVLALVPGLPAPPFVVLAAALGFVAHRLLRAKASELARETEARADAGVTDARSGTRAAAKRGELPAPVLVPLAVDLGVALAAEIAAGDGGRLVAESIPLLRERCFAETGIPLPALRVRAVATVAPRAYCVRLQESPIARGEIPSSAALARAAADRVSSLGVAATPARHADGSPAAWIPVEARPLVEAEGVVVLGAEEVLLDHVLEVARAHGHELLGIQEVQTLLEALERTHPALVREVVPKLVSPVLLADVLRRLAEERVSLRGLREILGALAEWAPVERDPVALTELVRQSLRRQITHQHAGDGGTIAVYVLDPLIEDTVREAIQKTATGSYLALEPELSRDIVRAAKSAVADGQGVLLTNAEIRRYVRRLIESELPRVPVLSYQELSPEAQLAPRGRVTVSA